MIDNVVLIVQGTLHDRDVHELIEKCHPLGMFDSIASLVSRVCLLFVCLFLSFGLIAKYLTSGFESDGYRL